MTTAAEPEESKNNVQYSIPVSASQKDDNETDVVITGGSMRELYIAHKNSDYMTQIGIKFPSEQHSAPAVVGFIFNPLKPPSWGTATPVTLYQGKKLLQRRLQVGNAFTDGYTQDGTAVGFALAPNSSHPHIGSWHTPAGLFMYTKSSGEGSVTTTARSAPDGYDAAGVQIATIWMLK